MASLKIYQQLLSKFTGSKIAKPEKFNTLFIAGISNNFLFRG